jgi:hypothetical protein
MNDIFQRAETFQPCYEMDIYEDTFTQECIHFKTYIVNKTEKKNQIKVCLHFFETRI